MLEIFLITHGTEKNVLKKYHEAHSVFLTTTIWLEDLINETKKVIFSRYCMSKGRAKKIDNFPYFAVSSLVA